MSDSTATPLEKAHAARAARKAAGIANDKTVRFSGSDKIVVGEKSYTEVEVIKLAAKREGESMRDYIRGLVLKTAAVDSQRPVKERTTKSLEQLVAEKKALDERIAKLSAQA